MIHAFGIVPWASVLLGGSVLAGMAGGICDGWRDARGNTGLAPAGDRFQFVGTLMTLTASSIMTQRLELGVAAVLGICAALAFLLPIHTGILWVLAGAGCGVGIGGLVEQLLLAAGWSGANVWATSIFAGYGALAGWIANRVALDSAGEWRFSILLARSQTQSRWWRDTLHNRLRATHRGVKRVALGSVAFGAVIALTALGRANSSPGSLFVLIVAVGSAPAATVIFAHLLAWGIPALTLPVHIVIALCLSVSASARNGTHGVARTTFVLTRYPRALCDSCLRMDAPLASRYAEGLRRCSKCGGSISYEGGAGRLVAVFTDGETSRAPRVFVRRAHHLVATGKPVDVTHIRVADGFSESEVERLAAFLLECPPNHPSKRIGVYAAVDSAVIEPYLHNLLSEHFSWAAGDPLG